MVRGFNNLIGNKLLHLSVVLIKYVKSNWFFFSEFKMEGGHTAARVPPPPPPPFSLPHSRLMQCTAKDDNACRDSKGRIYVLFKTFWSLSHIFLMNMHHIYI